MQPRILIPQPTSLDQAYNRLNWSVYAEAVRSNGGLPVSIDSTSSEALTAQAVRECDGMILPGSPFDVDPELYGQAREDECARPDAARQQVDRILLEEAFSSGKPLLAICFGMQMLNVFCGGTLVQDLNILPVNHAAARSVQVAHTVMVEPDSQLEEHLLASESTDLGTHHRLPVNSSHHQAVGIIGEGLRVAARSSEDQVVEAIELAHPLEKGVPAFLLGVQWHPERTQSSSTASQRLFAALVAAAAPRLTRA